MNGKFISFFVSSTATYYCFEQYIYWKGTATDTVVVTNLSKLFESLSRNKYTWLSSGIISAVLLVVILLIVLVLRKRIVIAIALVKEGSKYVFNFSNIRCFHTLIHFDSISGPLVQLHQLYFSQYFRGSSKLRSLALLSSLDCIWRLWAIRSIKLCAWMTIRLVYAQDRLNTTRTWMCATH